MKVIRVIALVASLVTFACLPDRAPFSAIPVPGGAAPAKPEGPEEVPIDLAQGDMRDALKEKYGRARVEIYAVDGGADWGQITQFYAERLKGTDWRTEPGFSRKKGYYEMTGWSRGGSFDRQALVIAYLEKPEGAGRNYLLVALAPEEGR